MRRLSPPPDFIPTPLDEILSFRLYWGYWNGEIVIFSKEIPFWTLLPHHLYTQKRMYKFRRAFWFTVLRRLLEALRGKRASPQLPPLTEHGALNLILSEDRLEVVWEQIPTWEVADCCRL